MNRRFCRKPLALLAVVIGILAMYVSCRRVQIAAFRKMLDGASVVRTSNGSCDKRSELENMMDIKQEQAEMLFQEELQKEPEEGEEKYHVLSDCILETSCRLSSRQVSDFNNSLDRELEADDITEDFGERMEELFRDKGADEMVRNFAVQHLARFAQERMVRGTWDVDSEEAAKIRVALEDAALEVDNSIGGTAMLALARLSEIDPHVDRSRLASRSASLVSNPSTRLSTRIAAAQLCGLFRVRSALPALRSLSSDSSSPTPLRLAASHAVETVAER